MITVPRVLSEQWIQQVGWTLVQFLWQGTLIALLFAAVRAAIRNRMSAHARYLLACGALGLMVLAPVLTLLHRLNVPMALAWPVPAPDVWRLWLPWIVAAWSGGVLVCSARVIAGWRVTARLRSMAVRQPEPEWQKKLAELAQRLEISRPVRLLVSSLVEVPVVVGWWTPVILIPVGMLAGLPPAFVEAVLAHELAHIRRWDYLVNLLQGFAEAVLFYHPAVWWVSAQIREERELCCDDLAVAASGDAVAYARALAELESQRPVHAQALAATGGRLVVRIKRLLGHTLPLSHVLPTPGLAGVMCVLWVIGIGAVVTQAAPPAGSVPPPQAATLSTEPAQSPHPILSTLLFGPVGPSPVHTTAVQQPRTAAAQLQAAAATGSIAGVITVDGGGPIKRARVVISSDEPNSGQNVLTDDEGRYAFGGLRAGRYTVTASKTGYFEATYGQKAPQHAGTPIPLTAGQKLERINVRLLKGGVIAGLVRDENGDPSPDTAVQAMRYDMSTGVRQLVLQSSTQTDDRGFYRLHNLPRGSYVVAASPRLDTERSAQAGGRAGGGGRGVFPPPPPPQASTTLDDHTDYVPVYFPGTVRASEASAISVGFGDERAGVDFGLRLVPMATLEGTITGLSELPASVDYMVGGRSGAGGAPALTGNIGSLQAFSMQLIDPDPQAGTPRPSGGGSLFGNHFTFTNVPPGHYVIQVRGTKPGADAPIGLWGDLELNVDGHRQDHLVIALQEGITITGHLSLDPPGRVADLGPAGVELQPIGSNVMGGAAMPRPRGMVDASGRFNLVGVVPGTYVVNVRGANGWAAKSIMVDGKDALDFGLQVQGTQPVADLNVVLTNASTLVAGTLLGADGKPTPDYTVIVFASDAKFWRPQARRIQATRPGTDGTFAIHGLPAGDYLVVAVTDVEPGEWYDSSLLEQLKKSASSFHLGDGEKKTQDLRIAK